MAAEVPGVFSRMDEMEPPYSQPTYTPERAMSAVEWSMV